MQNVSGYLLQNALVLLQNVAFITNSDNLVMFIRNCDSTKLDSFMSLTEVDSYTVSYHNIMTVKFEVLRELLECRLRPSYLINRYVSLNLV